MSASNAEPDPFGQASWPFSYRPSELCHMSVFLKLHRTCISQRRINSAVVIGVHTVIRLVHGLPGFLEFPPVQAACFQPSPGALHGFNPSNTTYASPRLFTQYPSVLHVDTHAKYTVAFLRMSCFVLSRAFSARSLVNSIRSGPPAVVSTHGCLLLCKRTWLSLVCWSTPIVSLPPDHV